MYGNLDGTRNTVQWMGTNPYDSTQLLVLGMISDKMQFTKYNKTNGTLISTLVIGDANSDSFLHGSLSSYTLYALGYSNSTGFTTGLMDAILVKINISANSVDYIRTIGSISEEEMGA